MASSRALLILVCATALAQTNDPVARLGRDIESGKVKVSFDEQRWLLPWLLDSLHIPQESQMLVFSKTGIQGIHTDTKTPRRLYFNDSVVVGNVIGGPIEIIAQDPALGMQFYILDQTPFRYREFAARTKPVSPFLRRLDCIHCHASHETGLPELLIRSTRTNDWGAPLSKVDGPLTDYRTPFNELWGGWFVTGKHTGAHQGNVGYNQKGEPVALKPPDASDVVALMVFEYQTRVMNLIARVALRPSQKNIADLADALLFAGEPPLPQPIEGSSGFAEKFSSLGPLREFDLKTRLMRGPVSWMILSEAYTALPAKTRSIIRERTGQ